MARRAKAAVAGGARVMSVSYAPFFYGRHFAAGSCGNDMASHTTNEFKSGLRSIIDGDPFSIVENEMVKPGKGQAFNRVRIRNLKTGRTIERTFKSGESVEAADVVDVDKQYL